LLLRGYNEGMDQRIASAIERIHADWRISRNISGMARAVGICPRHFRRIFRADTGLSPRDYVKRLRLSVARLLIEREDLALKEVAHAVGYADIGAFAKDFKSAYGWPRGKMRREKKPQEGAADSP